MIVKPRKYEIYFDEFSIYCEFSTDKYKFSGHIQKINSNGLSVILMNEDWVVLAGISGYLRIFYADKFYDIFCKLKWVDSPNQFVRYCIATLDTKMAYQFLSVHFPKFSFS
jgi:translation initiation factor RLI1